MSTPDESLPSIGPTSSSMETSVPSTGLPFNESIFCAGDSPAKTSVTLGSEQGCEKAPAADSGLNTSEPFAHYDPAISWWRTSQVCLLTMHLDEYSETWPRAGMMRNGIVYQQVPLVPLTAGIGCGLWPTPSAQEPGWKHIEVVDKDGNLPTHHNQRFYDKNTGRLVQKGLTQVARMWPTPSSNNGTGGATGLAGGSGNRKKLYKMLGEEEGKKMGCQSLNPYWVEWLMGYPIGWTDLKDSAMPLSRKSSKPLDE